MEKKRSFDIPKDFFTQHRPMASSKETFNEVRPVEWSKDIINSKKKAIVFSAKEK